MNYLQIIILFCIDRFAGERTTNAVYYLIKGKKSSQTIQDANWYQLQNLYHTFSYLTSQQYQDAIDYLLKSQFIVLTNERVSITVVGKKQLELFLNQYSIPEYLNGWIYHNIDRIFWERLSLIVQILSNLNADHTQFLPIQRGLVVQQWTKSWLKNVRRDYQTKEISQKIYSELNQFFEAADIEIDPAIVIFRFSGYNLSGVTSKQLAEQMKMDESYYYICFQSYLHFMIDTVWSNRSKYPFLYSLIEDQKRPIILTQSTKLTYDLLIKGRSLEEIERIRQLKRSTIEDHIVEIALMVPNFSIDLYVPPMLQKRITQVVKSLNTRKLKVIKEQVEEADYFSIRLVLSRIEN